MFEVCARRSPAPGGGGWLLCADTFPPCHPAIATPVALAAVVGDPFDASGGGPNPSMGGPNPSFEAVAVEDVPPVVGPGVNPLLWGDTKASVDEVPPVLGPGVNPLHGGDTKASVDVLAGALPAISWLRDRRALRLLVLMWWGDYREPWPATGAGGSGCVTCLG